MLKRLFWLRRMYVTKLQSRKRVCYTIPRFVYNRRHTEVVKEAILRGINIPDFIIHTAPSGSGKTTSTIEAVQQLLVEGEIGGYKIINMNNTINKFYQSFGYDRQPTSMKGMVPNDHKTYVIILDEMENIKDDCKSLAEFIGKQTHDVRMFHDRRVVVIGLSNDLEITNKMLHAQGGCRVRPLCYRFDPLWERLKLNTSEAVCIRPRMAVSPWLLDCMTKCGSIDLAKAFVTEYMREDDVLRLTETESAYWDYMRDNITTLFF